MGKKDKMKFNTNLGAGKEFLDFSGKTWSYKGVVPDYPIQPDGFTHDIDDADGNDKNAICLGIIGMIIIVLNSKSAKIKAEEVLPPFNQVIGIRGWHMVSEKDANFLAKTAIKKLTSAETSGDVFDLASYAPLEVKRSLLKKLFSIARYKIKPEYLDEAESRIVEDIVPNIFDNPDLELALLTGLIVKAEDEEKKTAVKSADTYVPTPVGVTPFPETDTVSDRTELVSEPQSVRETAVSKTKAAVDDSVSAFDELRRLYSEPTPESIVERRRAEAAAQTTVADPVVASEPAYTAPVEQVAPVSQPVAQTVSVSAENPSVSAAQPTYVPQPVAAAPVSVEMPQPAAPASVEIPQPSVPNFTNPVYAAPSFEIPQPNVPSFSQQPSVEIPQPTTAAPVSVEIPQPSVPNFSNPAYAAPSFEIPQPAAPSFSQQPSVEIPQPAAPTFSQQPSVEIPKPVVPNFSGAPVNMPQQQNPVYAQQSQQNPYYGQQQNPFSYPQQGMGQQQPYYAQQARQQNPYYGQQQNPYGYPQQRMPQQQNPFYQQGGNPYGNAQQGMPQQARPTDPNAPQNQNRGA